MLTCRRRRDLDAISDAIFAIPARPALPLPSSLAPASGAFGGEGTGGPALEETHRFVRTVCGRALFKPCSLIASVLYMERLHKKHQLYPLLQVDGWRVVTLTLLVIGAKVWDSDYPISNGDICSERSEPAKSVGSVCAAGEARRVNDCERRVLSLLDYRIHVSQAEFARAYLTIPFAFRDSALIRSDPCAVMIVARVRLMSVPLSLSRP